MLNGHLRLLVSLSYEGHQLEIELGFFVDGLLVVDGDRLVDVAVLVDVAPVDAGPEGVL